MHGVLSASGRGRCRAADARDRRDRRDPRQADDHRRDLRRRRVARLAARRDHARRRRVHADSRPPRRAARPRCRARASGNRAPVHGAVWLEARARGPAVAGDQARWSMPNASASDSRVYGTNGARSVLVHIDGSTTRAYSESRGARRPRRAARRRDRALRERMCFDVRACRRRPASRCRSGSS